MFTCTHPPAALQAGSSLKTALRGCFFTFGPLSARTKDAQRNTKEEHNPVKLKTNS